MRKEIDRRMHTAEHILNQTMIRMFNCGRCINAHIEKKKSKCDYRFTRTIGDAEIKEIEKRVNGVIQADLKIGEKYITLEQAQKQYNLKRLPEDVGDKIRIVNIGDYDFCPCIGPHADSTHQIGKFRITSADFQNGILRVRYKLEKI